MPGGVFIHVCAPLITAMSLNSHQEVGVIINSLWQKRKWRFRREETYSSEQLASQSRSYPDATLSAFALSFEPRRFHGKRESDSGGTASGGREDSVRVEFTGVK